MPVTKAERERLNIWKNRVGWSRENRKNALDAYETYKFYFMGEQWETLTRTALSDVIMINLIFAHIRSTLPMLYFQNPHYYVRPKRAEFKTSAEIAEWVLNYFCDKGKIKREIRLATLDALLMIGIVKDGYNPVFITNPKKGQRVIAGIDENGNEILVVDPETNEMIVEPDELLYSEDFFSKRVSPKNMLFDPEKKNFLDDMNWIGEEIIQRLDDVKTNEYFKNRDKVKESHFATDKQYYGMQSQTEVKDDLKRVKLIHIYDFKDESFKIYAEGQQNQDLGFLFEDNIPDGINYHPYSILKFHEIPDEFFPLSEVKLLKPIQDEINKARSILMIHAKRFLRKYEFETGYFADEEEKEKFKEPEDGMLVEVNRGALGKLQPIQDATVDPALYEHMGRLLADFWMVAGRTEQERGIVERRKTMFESSQIEKYGQLRSQDAISLVEDFAKDIAKKKLDQLQANLRVPVAIEIAGEIGKYWEEGLTKENIYGDFDLQIDIGATTPKVPEVEREQLVKFLDLISSIPGIENILAMPTDKEIDIGEFIMQLAKQYDITEYDIIKKKGQQQTYNVGDLLNRISSQREKGMRQKPGKTRKRIYPR